MCHELAFRLLKAWLYHATPPEVSPPEAGRKAQSGLGRGHGTLQGRQLGLQLGQERITVKNCCRQSWGHSATCWPLGKRHKRSAGGGTGVSQPPRRSSFAGPARKTPFSIPGSFSLPQGPPRSPGRAQEKVVTRLMGQVTGLLVERHSNGNAIV